MAGVPLPAPLFVEVVPPGRARDRPEFKLQIYFQSPKSSGGGECVVHAVDRERGLYRVQFRSEEVKKRVQASEYRVISSNDQTLNVRILQDSEVMDSARNALTSSSTSQATSSLSSPSALPSRNSFEKKQLSEKCTDNPPASITKKIFLSVSATLNTDLFTKEERDQAVALLPTLKIEKKSSELGVENVTGDYNDVEVLHCRLKMLIPRSCRRDEPAPPRRPQDLEKITENNQKEGNENDVEVSNMEVPSAIFEYFSHVCKEEVQELEQRYSVKMTSTEDGSGVTLVRFTSAGNPSYVEKAQQKFVTNFQKVVADVKQEIIPVTSIPQLTKASQMLNAKFKSILVKREGSTLILRGPAKELSAAKDLLKEMEKENLPNPSDFHVPKTGIPLDADVFEFLEPKLATEIQSINQAFGTVMEKKKSLNGKTTCIFFKPATKKKSPDLTSQAYDSFFRAYKKVSAALTETAISLKYSLDLVKKVNEFFVYLQNENPQVQLIKEEDTLIIRGFPEHMYSSEKHIQQFLFAGFPVSLADKLSPIHTSKAGASSGASHSGDRKGHSFPSGDPSSAKAGKAKPEEEMCSICMDKIGQKEVLPKCKHAFCKGCIREAMKYKPVCPVCNEFYGKMEGNQPPGKMEISKQPFSLPGYEGCGTIIITYQIHDGIQTENHPNPGKRFYGVSRTAYLPDNAEGREILQLLRRAFDQKLIFTVGQSRTTGMDNVVTWNDIHHKTSMHGGVNRFGYPDPNYLKRVREELKAKGIA